MRARRSITEHDSLPFSFIGAQWHRANNHLGTCRKVIGRETPAGDQRIGVECSHLQVHFVAEHPHFQLHTADSFASPSGKRPWRLQFSLQKIEPERALVILQSHRRRRWRALREGLDFEAWSVQSSWAP